MAICTFVVGPSGQGKSTSIENLDPKTTFIFSVTGKPLPFRGANNYSSENKNYIDLSQSKSKADNIIKLLDKIGKSDRFDVVVVDDFQYLMSMEFMDRCQEAGWDKFTEIGLHAYDVLRALQDNLPDHMKAFVLGHDEVIKTGLKSTRKVKTIGKMLDDKIELEGLFTIVLFTSFRPDKSEVSEKYRFVTQTDGETTAKSPKGMFEDMEIPNDLQYVKEKIDEYYGINQN